MYNSYFKLGFVNCISAFFIGGFTKLDFNL